MSRPKSILIMVPRGADRPQAFLVRSDGSQKDAGLKAGRNKVIHSSRGFSELHNAGYCDLQYEVPAPPIAPPLTDQEQDS